MELDDAIETTDVLPQIKRLGLKRHHLEAMFITADDNGDGQIDCIEFLRGFSDLLNIPLNRKDIVKMAAEQSTVASEDARKEFELKMAHMNLKLDALLKKQGISPPELPTETDVSSRPIVKDSDTDVDDAKLIKSLSMKRH